MEANTEWDHLFIFAHILSPSGYLCAEFMAADKAKNRISIGELVLTAQ